jgi:beta-phosphoglucomutase
MDGVIIDSEALHRKAYFKTFASLGVRVSEELYGTMTGSSTINVFQQLVDHFNLDEDPEALVIQKREHYIYDFENDPSLHLVDGVEEIIKYFHHKGLTLILASSSAMQNIDRVFNRFNLNQYFSAKISGADLLRSKPNPEIFEKAAILGNTAKENCVVIEDSENGIRAAKAAGIFVFGYKNALARNQDLKEADLIISTFSALKEYL